MKACVVGLGQQGSCVAYALGKLGVEVYGVDPVHEYVDGLKVIVDHIEYFRDEDFDVVFSAAPYFANQEIANFCFSNGWKYCDLGGDPDVTNSIHDMASDSGNVAFTDLGLAPGLVNILGEEFIKSNPEAKTVELRVGGIPIERTGTLQYKRTWSVPGLCNEYWGEVSVLKDGVVSTKNTLDGEEYLCFPGVGDLEAFYTKGAINASIDTMGLRGVVNCDYKTIRYPGHVKLLKFLTRECGLNKSEFEHALENSCPETAEDQVLIIVRIDDKQYGWQVMHGDGWTAMQKATAFPAASVAYLIAAGEFGEEKLLDYSMIPFDKMVGCLNTIGGFPDLIEDRKEF